MQRVVNIYNIVQDVTTWCLMHQDLGEWCSITETHSQSLTSQGVPHPKVVIAINCEVSY